MNIHVLSWRIQVFFKLDPHYRSTVMMFFSRVAHIHGFLLSFLKVNSLFFLVVRFHLSHSDCVRICERESCRVTLSSSGRHSWFRWTLQLGFDSRAKFQAPLSANTVLKHGVRMLLFSKVPKKFKFVIKLWYGGFTVENFPLKYRQLWDGFLAYFVAAV